MFVPGKCILLQKEGKCVALQDIGFSCGDCIVLQEAPLITLGVKNHTHTPCLHKLFRQVHMNFCLLPCDTNQEPNRNRSEKLVQLNFFILGDVFGVNLRPVKVRECMFGPGLGTAFTCATLWLVVCHCHRPQLTKSQRSMPMTGNLDMQTGHLSTRKPEGNELRRCH